MSRDPIAWIVARDGSIHATRPPILAAGQAMLCGRPYERLDLRVRGGAGLPDRRTCAACVAQLPDPAAAFADAPREKVKRAPPRWP